VLKLVQDGFDVTEHKDVDSASFVVPVEGEAAVLGAGPVRSNLIQVGEGIHQVLGVLVAKILTPEEDLDSVGVGGCYALLTRVNDEVAANCEADAFALDAFALDAFALGLDWFDSNGDKEIGGLAAYR
jgi:hypothetical protein